MVQEIFKDLKNEMKLGYLKKKHSFRYVYLATVADGVPHQRTVVLRDVVQDQHPIIYTDARSSKVEELKENPFASLIMYNHKKLMQITLSGKIKMIESGDYYEDCWSRVQGNAQRNFITEKAPGTPIEKPEDISYGDDHHFMILELVPDKIEYLHLTSPNHVRARFTAEDNWQGEFVNP